jgi:hypothetical protein
LEGLENPNWCCHLPGYVLFTTQASNVPIFMIWTSLVNCVHVWFLMRLQGLLTFGYDGWDLELNSEKFDIILGFKSFPK